MSELPERHPMGCREFRRAAKLSRRDALHVGGLFGLGLSLPHLLHQRAEANDESRGSFGRAKQVIMLYLHGGHPQQETFDPKPHGPSAVRGEFGDIATSLPGVRFSELLPQSARIMHKLAIIRSMSHENPNHVTASLPANTGHKHPPGTPQTDFPPANDDFPPFGAVLDSIRPKRDRLPSWVRIGPLMRRSNGTVLHGQLPGLLGAKHNSFVVDQPLLEQDVEIEAIQPRDGLTSARLSSRRQLLAQFDEHRRLIDQSAHAESLDAYYQKAFGLLGSARTRVAFDLASESAATRDRYGRSEFGQRCLLARRLAEAGVPMVNVSYCHTPRGSWDTHSGNFKKMKATLGPELDTALSALVNDLDERGRLDDTPKINKNAGRDHWPWVYSLVLAGAGVKAGTVYGASDNSAAYPAETPHEQRDFAATLYHLMGVDPETVLYDALNRPHHLVIGKPIDGLLT
jgi:hypothetical protein